MDHIIQNSRKVEPPQSVFHLNAAELSPAAHWLVHHRRVPTCLAATIAELAGLKAMEARHA